MPPRSFQTNRLPCRLPPHGAGSSSIIGRYGIGPPVSWQILASRSCIFHSCACNAISRKRNCIHSVCSSSPLFGQEQLLTAFSYHASGHGFTLGEIVDLHHILGNSTVRLARRIRVHKLLIPFPRRRGNNLPAAHPSHQRASEAFRPHRRPGMPDRCPAGQNVPA